MFSLKVGSELRPKRSCQIRRSNPGVKVVYDESRKREVKTRPIYECRGDERLTTQVEKSRVRDKMYNRVGVMKDYYLKLRYLRAADTLGGSRTRFFTIIFVIFHKNKRVYYQSKARDKESI
jgi:hypothetical protein